jgi:hypothetical protein
LANFRLLGDCFLLSVFGKLQKEYNFLFPPLSSVNAMLDKFRQNGLGCTLGDFCSQSHLVTLKAAQVKTWEGKCDWESEVPARVTGWICEKMAQMKPNFFCQNWQMGVTVEKI